MMPEAGMEATYIDVECVLRIEILEYNPLTNKEIFRFKVLENLNKGLPCIYDVGNQFVRERIRGEESELWNLVFG